MATRSVRFDFYCEKPKDKLHFHHDLPASLITDNVHHTQGDTAYMQAFVTAIEPIINEHERVCFNASADQCGICGEPKAKALMTPMSWLHVIEEPFINVWVNPICGKAKCELEERKRIQEMMKLLNEESGRERIAAGKDAGPGIMKVLACKVCGKVEGAKHCSRCKVVAYCGTEHQKEDWKVHKRLCPALAAKNPDLSFL